MEKKLFFAALFLSVVFQAALPAEDFTPPRATSGLYFDGGIGAGLAWTKIDGEDFDKGKRGVGSDIGLKLGYGPFQGLPLYLAADFTGVLHRFSYIDGYIQFNSFITGASLIFYPIRQLQLSGSFGYSFVANSSDVLSGFYKSKWGIGGDVSIALDVSRNSKHTALIGLRFAGTKNYLESGSEQITYLVDVFVRYAFRHKQPAVISRSDEF